MYGIPYLVGLRKVIIEKRDLFEEIKEKKLQAKVGLELCD